MRVVHITTNELHVAGAHHVHDPADRVVQTLAPLANGSCTVSFTKNAAGDTIYLPYSHDKIRSVLLPGNPGVGGPTMFLTANLDGCCMYMDVKQNGDVAVFHSNAITNVSPTMVQSATMPTFQTPGCRQLLASQYDTAKTYYAGITGKSLALAKGRYLREVDHILRDKAGHGRTGPNGVGLPEHGRSFTTFGGFFVNNHWEFWFQTTSQFIYSRPAKNLKSLLGKRVVNPDVTHDPYKVVEQKMIFRA